MAAKDQGVFRIWLKNLAPGTQYYWGEGTMYMVGQRLLELFTQVCARPESRFSGADYSWEPDAASIRDHEILVYFLPSSASSIVSSRLHQTNLGPSGSTFPDSNGVLSEVYLDVTQGDANIDRLIGNLVFHEMMHNKLDAYLNMGQAVVQDIHLQGGGGLATGGKIDSFLNPTPQNLTLMANALLKSHPQWTGFVARKSPYP
jgi:hypothetical protein